MHQLAYLTPERVVAWKCLSLQAHDCRSTGRFVPVAYASRSKSFFPNSVGTHSPGVLWVVSAPTFRRRGTAEIRFPPTLTAKLVVERVVTGDTVRRWASDQRDCDLDIPEGDGEAFQQWRTAPGIRDPIERVIFRITRDFAMLSWKELRRQCRSQDEAWASVRTAIADRRCSSFLAHVDAEECLRKALRLPAGAKIGSRLESPRQVRSEHSVAELEELASTGTKYAIFMNYRWNERSADVAALAKALLAMRCGVWLDGLAIPHFAENPIVRTGKKPRRKDPPRVDLERLLNTGIDASALFLCLAASDYQEPPADAPEGSKNWALREYEHARTRASKSGVPEIRVVDLGGAPDVIKNENRGRVLPFDRGGSQLLVEIAALAHRG